MEHLINIALIVISAGIALLIAMQIKEFFGRREISKIRKELKGLVVINRALNNVMKSHNDSITQLNKEVMLELCMIYLNIVKMQLNKHINDALSDNEIEDINAMLTFAKKRAEACNDQDVINQCDSIIADVERRRKQKSEILDEIGTDSAQG